MQHRLIRSFAAAAALTLTAPLALHAQYAPPPLPPAESPYPAQSDYPPAPEQSAPQQPAAAVYDQGQLDQLLAPIALYPDQLLGQILMASTYPLEVVEAARWLQDPNNAALRGPVLAQALDQLDWDPSVKSLAAFPSVIQMMNDQLEWTKSLGDAFLAQQADVMESVQRLRHEALNNGTLQSTPRLVVTTEGPDIIIQPADPNVVYVPYYDPSVVYGAWAYPDYPPYYFAPPPGYAYEPAFAGIGFGVGYSVFGPFWGWDDFDWRRHRVHIDRDRFGEMDRFRRGRIAGDTWQHDPVHRRGVAYQDPVSQQRFTRSTLGPQDLNRTAPGAANRGFVTPTQPNTAIRPGTANSRFPAMPPSNVAPTQQGPTVLRGGNAPQPQGVPQGQGVDPRFRAQMGNQPVVPQSRPVTPQMQPVQPRVVTPPAPQNRAVEQDRRSPNGS